MFYMSCLFLYRTLKIIDCFSLTYCDISSMFKCDVIYYFCVFLVFDQIAYG